MKHYTGFEYLLIDVANQAGHDKMLFEHRIQWAYDHFDDLESMAPDSKERPLYLKAVQAVRAAQRGEPSGHLVGLDACCSGAQIMSTLTGCLAGSKATNLVWTGVRADAYTMVTDAASMAMGGSVGNISRKNIKNATMTHLYGSRAEPKKLFGEDTPELDAFYEGVTEVLPGANELLQDLVNSWQAYQDVHSWVLPDNFHARVKTMEKVECRIEVDEMDHATFEYEYKVQCGKERDVKNAANVIHSIDAWVLRSMHRRCNYNKPMVLEAMVHLGKESIKRTVTGSPEAVGECGQIGTYLDLFERTNLADAVILPYINEVSVRFMSDDHIERMIDLCNSMLDHEPFELVTIHDEFKCHANNCNFMRQHYINIFAEMADSNMLDDIFYQITGSHVSYNNAYIGLSDLIRESEYALS